MSVPVAPAAPAATPETPAAPATPAAPQTSNDYRAAAVAMLEQQDASAAPPADPPPAPETPPAEPPKAETPEAKPEEKPEVPKRNFDALAVEKARLRKETEALKAREEKLAKYEAAQSPLEALQAKGYSYNDLVQQVLTGKATEKKPEAPKADDNPVVKEVAELKRMLLEERAQKQRMELSSKVAEAARAGGDKYRFVNGMKAEGQAMALLEQYVSETGTMPAETLEESVAVVLEAMEAQLSKAADVWRPLLTDKQPVVTSNPGSTKSAVQSAASDQARAVQKTLNNSQASAAQRTAPEPKTSDDYRRLALAALESQQPG